MFRKWQPAPPNPTSRFYGYDSLIRDKPSILERIARWIKPSLNQVLVDNAYWRESYILTNSSDITLQLSAQRCGLRTDKELEAHLNQVRNEAWQVVQEFSIARWWFLRSILVKNPFYSKIREEVRSGATIVDLGCGFGQELRFLRDDGATGKMYGVDIKKEMWELGLKLFNDFDSDSDLVFRQLDIMEDNIKDYKTRARVKNPLFEFKEKTDIYLLNDFLSFLGPIAIEHTLMSIAWASRPGTKIIGWAIGQDGDEVQGMNVWGTGRRGTIHNSTSFESSWWIVQNETNTKWSIEVEMEEFRDLGFDGVDYAWFGGNFFEDRVAPKPHKLMGLCFLATRTD